MPDQEITAKTAKNEIVLVCDDLDYAAIQQAMVNSFFWLSILYCVGLMLDQEITAKTAKNEIVLVCDDLDYAAIQQAMARRQAFRVTPDSGSNVAGATVAEICRGWHEMLTTDVDDNGFG